VQVVEPAAQQICGSLPLVGQTLAVPLQAPAVQTSFSVHGSPSSHGVSLAMLLSPQTPLLQAFCWQGLLGSGQLLRLLLVHVY
jgi:hypothetical protein